MRLGLAIGSVVDLVAAERPRTSGREITLTVVGDVDGEGDGRLRSDTVEAIECAENGVLNFGGHGPVSSFGARSINS